ncbi:heme NO-binding protein [Pseudomonas taiwanensis]|nr:heme NO-binding protein [Pseudomonas taiwanensis]
MCWGFLFSASLTAAGHDANGAANLISKRLEATPKGLDPRAPGGCMKGIVFNLLEEVVTRHQGEDAWDALLDGTGLDGVYTALGSYPDDHIYRLVAAAAEALDMSSFEVLRWFGREAMPSLASRYPAYFDPHDSTHPFILSVNQIIHPEVRMIYPGADVPTFGFRDETDGTLMMTYRSPRRLCALAHGFIEGAAVHFGESLAVDHLACMHRGDSECRCRITFHGKTRG